MPNSEQLGQVRLTSNHSRCFGAIRLNCDSMLSTDLDHTQSPLGACGCSLHRQRWVQYPAPKQTMVQLKSTIGSLNASSIANPAIEPRAKTPRSVGITFHISGF